MLNDKTAIVTGSLKGIGKETSELFLKNGATVYLNGRDEKKLVAAVDKYVSNGLKAKIFTCDVSKPDEVKSAFQKFRKDSSSLDILVNNAGILDDALIGMVSSDQINKTFSSNTYSVLYMSQYASRLMIRNNHGSIINISSIIGTNGNRGQSVYSGSKAAVIGITKSLSKELGRNLIRVNAITPGFIDTDMARSIPEDIFKERLSSIEMQRIGTPADVANCALFLASDLSSYVTGQIIGVDGGMLI